MLANIVKNEQKKGKIGAIRWNRNEVKRSMLTHISTCYVLSTALLCECRWLDGLVTWKNNLRNRWTCSHNAARYFPSDVFSVRVFSLSFNSSTDENYNWMSVSVVILFFYSFSCFIFFCFALINSLSAIFFRLNRITFTRRIGKWSIKFKYSKREKKLRFIVVRKYIQLFMMKIS